MVSGCVGEPLQAANYIPVPERVTLTAHQADVGLAHTGIIVSGAPQYGRLIRAHVWLAHTDTYREPATAVPLSTNISGANQRVSIDNSSARILDWHTPALLVSGARR